MAEWVLKRRMQEAGLGDLVEVDSAGTAGWHEGNDMDPRARRTLEAAGYHPEHKARQFRSDWLGSTDLVLVMDELNLADVRRLSPGRHGERVRLLRSFDPAATSAEVPDPYYGGLQGFSDVLAMIESAADGVVEHARRALP